MDAIDTKMVEQLQRRVAELEAQQLNTNNRMERMEQQMQTVFVHIGGLYKAQTIEQTVEVLGELSAKTLEAENSSFWCIDTTDDNRIFTSENGKRNYADREQNEMLSIALNKGEPVVSKQAVAIPIRAENEVMGVVVAEKCKITSQEVLQKFSSDGEIGSVFKLGLEKERKHQIGITDKLTRLNNREGMAEYALSTMVKSLENNCPITLVMCDIDHFKSVNDTYGHDVGDKVLQHVAKLLKDNIRTDDNDRAFRFGGEEFILAFDDVNKADAFILADRIRTVIEETPCDIGNGKSINVTISMGVEQIELARAPSRDEIMDVIDVSLKNADTRLYAAKETGRNKVMADVSENDIQKAQQKIEVSDVLEHLDCQVKQNLDSSLVVKDNDTGKEIMFDSYEALAQDINNGIKSYNNEKTTDESSFTKQISDFMNRCTVDKTQDNPLYVAISENKSFIKETEPRRNNTDEMLKESNAVHKKLIGNTPYNALGAKADLKYFGNLNNRHAENITRELDKQGVKYSGVVLDEKTTLTLNKADAPKFYEAESNVKQMYSSKYKSLEKVAEIQDKAEKEINNPTQKKEGPSR